MEVLDWHRTKEWGWSLCPGDDLRGLQEEITLSTDCNSFYDALLQNSRFTSLQRTKTFLKEWIILWKLLFVTNPQLSLEINAAFTSVQEMGCVGKASFDKDSAPLLYPGLIHQSIGKIVLELCSESVCQRTNTSYCSPKPDLDHVWESICK